MFQEQRFLAGAYFALRISAFYSCLLSRNECFLTLCNNSEDCVQVKNHKEMLRSQGIEFWLGRDEALASRLIGSPWTA